MATFAESRTTMGRPKKGQKPRPKVDRPVKQIGIRSTPEWADWVREAAKFCRTDVGKLIDAALIRYLRDAGFEEPPPPRIQREEPRPLASEGNGV